jgi:ATP-dependent DNA ligase
MARPFKPLPIVSNLPRLNPIIPVRRQDIFDSSDWVYELKYDGFRALAYVDDGRCRFVSRKGNEMKGLTSFAPRSEKYSRLKPPS